MRDSEIILHNTHIHMQAQTHMMRKDMRTSLSLFLSDRRGPNKKAAFIPFTQRRETTLIKVQRHAQQGGR
jgi:hypothetical protein